MSEKSRLKERSCHSEDERDQYWSERNRKRVMAGHKKAEKMGLKPEEVRSAPDLVY